MVARMVIMEHRLFAKARIDYHNILSLCVCLLYTATVVLNVIVMDWKDIPVITGTSV